MEVLEYKGKVFKMGALAAFKKGWGSKSRLYEGKAGKIVELSAATIRISYEDGQRMGPSIENVYPIIEKNKDAAFMLDKEW